MNRDDIIRIAREAGAAMIHGGEYALMGDFALETFFQKAYAAGAAAEREACAKVCEVHGSMAKHSVWMAEECAALIRARGQQ